ncbi:MAG: hypothetical protein KJ626_03605 [Verrucomicrobia bacterium]|nr:hypothetical protein [Verrucomicrobiota bacterium]
MAFEKLKARWQVTSLFQVILIMLAFSLAGMSIVHFRRPVFRLLHLTAETSMWIKVPAYILFVVPLYQVLLMFYGTVLGQFRFFWEKEKKMGRWIARQFRKSS